MQRDGHSADKTVTDFDCPVAHPRCQPAHHERAGQYVAIETLYGRGRAVCKWDSLSTFGIGLRQHLVDHHVHKLIHVLVPQPMAAFQPDQLLVRRLQYIVIAFDQ